MFGTPVGYPVGDCCGEWGIVVSLNLQYWGCLGCTERPELVPKQTMTGMPGIDFDFNHWDRCRGDGDGGFVDRLVRLA